MHRGRVGLAAGLMAMAIVAVGCTGRSVVVRPDPQSLSATAPRQFAALGVRAVPAAYVYPAAGEPVAGFASTLERSGVSEKVYYPIRPDDTVDAVLDTQIDVTFDQNNGSNFAKAFFTGFTMFLLEPLFWYEYDYVLSGKVDVVKQNGSRLRLDATSTGTFGVKFFSLAEANEGEGETLRQAKESLYRQMLGQLAGRTTSNPSP